MKAFFLTLVMLAAVPGFAQQTLVKTTKDTSRYTGFYRLQISEPPYGLKKIYTLLPGIKYGGEWMISDSAYQSLPVAEKFTYNAVHAESYA